MIRHRIVVYFKQCLHSYLRGFVGVSQYSFVFLIEDFVPFIKERPCAFFLYANGPFKIAKSRRIAQIQFVAGVIGQNPRKYLQIYY